jgi:methylmalonyl-CoA mutase N-terminal domain/subunit
LLYQLVAEEQGVSTGRLTGTIRDDAAGGHRAGGRFLFPPGPSLRLFADVLTYCRAELPKWNVIPVPGDRGARVGAPPARESAHDPVRERPQAERIAKLRAWRDQDRLDRRLQRVRKAAIGDGNVLYPMKDALHASATIGEVCGVLREVWGVYRPAGAPGCERASGPGTSF